MAYVTCTVASPHAPGEAFARITRWEEHPVPFTRTRRTPEGFVARTGLGPVGVDDPMTVTRFEPPHRAEIVKTGRVVRGWAVIEVEPAGTGSRVTWREEIALPGLPGVVVAPAARAMVRRVLTHLVR